MARRAPRDGSEDRVARGVERFAGDDAEFAAAEEDVPRYEAGGPVDDAALGGAVEAEGDEGSKMVRADAPLELALAWGCLGATMRLGRPWHDHVGRLEGDAVMGAEAGEGLDGADVGVDGVAGDGGADPALLARAAGADVLAEELEGLGVIDRGLDVSSVSEGEEGAP